MPDPKTERRRATIYDIAREAGVSHQSVSRYVRGMDMRASTTEKIRAAMEVLDYTPNLSARALITGRSTRIGALTHELHQVGPATVIQGATAAAREAGYLLDVFTVDMGDADEINRALRTLMQYDLAGIVAFASTDGIREVFERTAFSMPAVIASENDEPESIDASRIATHGLDDLIEHLARLGHRTFLHIAGPGDWAAARNRLHAYEASVARHGLHSNGIMHGDWSAKSGHDVVEALADHELPTAIVAANDQMALGAMHALQARGLRVPSDISVTGLDDNPEAAYFTPSLTTVRIDFRTQGRDAVRALLARVGSPDLRDPAPAVVESPTLILRESTGRARV